MKSEDQTLTRNAPPQSRAWMGYFGVTLLSLAMSVGAIFHGWPADPHMELPEPHIHDEYSYLLAADTFSHGRLTNPAHPMWKFLQTFYVLQRPSYQSKYPPGQGLVMAIGQVLTGIPIVGVWIATAALVLSAAWMLAAFVPRRWAIAGAASLAVHPQIVEWSRIYWGGTAAAVGGVLVLGGSGRLFTSRRRIDLAAIGVGLGILMLTRPYEGFAAAVPVLASFLWKLSPAPGTPGEGRGESDFGHGKPLADRDQPHFSRNHPHPNPLGGSRRIPSLLPGYRERGPERRHAIISVLVAFTPFAIWAAYYNFRVTGSPVTMPYLAYEKQYAAAPPLLIQSARDVPEDIPAEMREYAQTVELPHYRAQRSVGGFVSSSLAKIRELLGDLIGVKPGSAMVVAAGLVLFLITVMAVLAIYRDRKLRMPAAAVVCVTAATLLSNWTRSQYAAPAAGSALLLAVAAVRELERRVSRAGVSLGVVMCIAFAAIAFNDAARVDSGSNRAAIARSLAAEPGRQLVLVRYLPNHRPDDEWVENGADIDGAQTVWARDLGPESNKPLLAYFHGRAVWRLTVGHDSASIAEAK